MERWDRGSGLNRVGGVVDELNKVFVKSMAIGILQWDCQGERHNEERGALRRREETCSKTDMLFVLVLVYCKGTNKGKKEGARYGSMDRPEMSRPFCGKAADEDTCKVRNESLSQL